MRLSLLGLNDRVFDAELVQSSLFIFDFIIIYETINIQEFTTICESTYL